MSPKNCHISHSVNLVPRIFSTRIMAENQLCSTLAEKLPSIKIIHGKPCHPDSQGAVERANRDIKDALFTMMLDHGNDQC